MMLLARGKFFWFDIVFFLLGAMVVYPDRVLSPIGDRLGREFHWAHAVVLSVLSLGLLLFLVDYLQPLDPRVDLVRGLAALVVLAGMRIVYWFVDTTVSV
jgi:hypothetical protein